MAGLTELSKTTDPVEILRILQEEAYKAELPKSEQQGLLTKPTISKDDESYGIVKFISDWWTDSEEKVKEARKEVLEGLVNMPMPTLPQPPVPDELMDVPTADSEPVIEGAPEQPEMLVPEPYKLDADTRGNELGLRGLMSPELKESIDETVSDVVTESDADGVQPTDGKDTELNTYTNDFANVYLTQHEGLEEHKSLEGGKDTEALGVKFSLGLKRENYTSDSEYAAAVAIKHRDKAKAQFSESEWNELPQSVKYAITDLHYNVGKIGSTADKDTTVNKMENTLEFVGMSTKDKKRVSLISLAKRRAWNWNKAAADMGVSEIAKIKQIPIKGGTKFEYLDSSDSVVYSFSNNRTPVKLDSTGKATTLTTTREINL